MWTPARSKGFGLFFRDAGGALTLASVVETSAEYLPRSLTNQGADNSGVEGANGSNRQARQGRAVPVQCTRTARFFAGRERHLSYYFRLIRNALHRDRRRQRDRSSVEHRLREQRRDPLGGPPDRKALY